jgi:hypothetical protein
LLQVVSFHLDQALLQIGDREFFGARLVGGQGRKLVFGRDNTHEWIGCIVGAIIGDPELQFSRSILLNDGLEILDFQVGFCEGE